MRKNLTEQQKKFCKEYVSGKSASQAYAIAYSVKGKTKQLVAYNANKILDKEEIKQEIEEIKKKNSSFLNYTAEESACKIKQIQELAIIKGDMTNALKAEEMLQKITGINKDNNALQIGIVGDFKEFYAAICAKKDYGSTKSINTKSKTVDLSNCPKTQEIENK